MSLANVTKAVTLQQTCNEMNSFQDMCSYLSVCDETDGIFPFALSYYCASTSFGGIYVWASMVMLSLWFALLGATSSDFLCINLQSLSSMFHIPENLTGLTLLAFGNASPDLFSTYEAFRQNSASLAVGEMLGATLFVSCFVIGCICVFGADSFAVPKRAFLRDLAFFIGGVLLCLVFFIDGELGLLESSILLGYYGLYVLVVGVWHVYSEYRKKITANELKSRSQFDVPEIAIDLEHQDTLHKEESEEFINTAIRPSLLTALTYTSMLTVLEQTKSDVISLDQLSNEHVLPQSAPQLTTPLEEEEEEEHNYNFSDRPQTAPEFAPYRDVPGTDHENVPLVDYKVIMFQKLKDIVRHQYHHNRDPKLFLFPNLKDFKEKSLMLKVVSIVLAPFVCILRLTVPVIEDDDEQINYNTWLLLLINSVFFPITFMVMTQGVSISSVLISFLLSLSLTGCVTVCIYKNWQSAVRMIFAIIGFVMSILWISFLASQVVSIIKFYQLVFGLSEAILGLTLFALGNSLGDFISNITIAKMGFPVMALSACTGGPMVNLLIGMGVSGLIVIPKQGALKVHLTPSLYVSVVALLLNLVFLVFALSSNNWIFHRWIGYVMILIWALSTMINIVIEIYTR